MGSFKKSTDPIGCAVSRIGSGAGRPIITGILILAMALHPAPLSSFAWGEEEGDPAQPIVTAEMQEADDESESAAGQDAAETIPDMDETAGGGSGSVSVQPDDSSDDSADEAQDDPADDPSGDSVGAITPSEDPAVGPSDRPAGNQSRGPADTPAISPTVIVTVGTASLSNGDTIYVGSPSTVSVTVSGLDPATPETWTLVCGTDSAAAVSSSEIWEHSISVGNDGAYAVEVLREGASVFSAIVVVDTGAPVAHVSFEGVASLGDEGIIPVTVTDDNLDADGSYAMLLDESGAPAGSSHSIGSDGTAEIDVSALEDGVYSGVRVYAIDKAGNASEQSFPHAFEVDASAPDISVTYYRMNRRTKRWEKIDDAGEIEGKSVPYKVKAVVTVSDPNLDLERTTIEADESASVKAWERQGEGLYSCEIVFSEGLFGFIPARISYTVTAFDTLGHSSAKQALWVHDATPPEVGVDFNLTGSDGSSEDDELGEILLFNGSHEIVVSVSDDHLSQGTLDGAVVTLYYYEIADHEIQHSSGQDPQEEVISDLTWIGGNGSFEARIVLEDDRVYAGVNVAVEDDLGNANRDAELYQPTGTTEEEQGQSQIDAMTANSEFIALLPFEIDATDPIIEITLGPAASDGSMGGTDVYGREVVATITVEERNFDENGFTISGVDAKATESTHWINKAPGIYTRTVVYSEEGIYGTVTVSGSDMVGRRAATETIPELILDLHAPAVDDVKVSTSPAGVAAGDEAEIQFHASATAMTIAFSDAIGIDRAEIDGYSDTVIDTDAGTATITLVEGEDFGRGVVLTLTDYAGNTSTWSISETGSVRLVGAQDAVSKGNTAISGIVGNFRHPELLILDTTAPIATLEGAVAGTYYTADRLITARIIERNFPYTRVQDSQQVLVTISFRPGHAGAATQAITIPAASFTGSDSSWIYTRVLSEDGHYSLSMRMTDFAQHASNVASIGEFVIDKTAPTLTVTFDNNDVRNGRYYNAARTATITVVEHNFDPSLFSVETTGSIGGWSTNGDIHTCIVSFAADGVHNLAVSGADRAGNQAAAYAADEFVVDLTAPTVTIANFDGSDMSQVAYNGTVAPIITFADEANFDAGESGATWTLARANGAAGDPAEAGNALSGNARTVTWEDFAHEITVDDIYTLSARVTDLAGNEAEASVEFSVNRFGSTFQILGVDTQKGEWDSAAAERREAGTVLLTSAPTVRIREINVSGSSSEIDPENAHFVDIEHAHSTNSVELVDAASAQGGYLLEQGSSSASGTAGWAEYTYTVLSGNFGEENASYANDGGQGSYNVTVGSYDRTNGVVRDDDGNALSYGRANTSGIFFENEGGSGVEAQANVGFILDEKGPEIISIDVPDGIEVAGSYRVTVFVHDDVGGDTDVLTAAVNGEDIDAADIERVGPGTFAFDVDATTFGALNAISVDVTVTDYDGRSDSAAAQLNVTTMVAEGIAIGAVAAAALGGIVAARRRKKKETV